MRRRFARRFLTGACVAVAALLVTACDGAVESVTAVVENGEATTPVTLTDLERRPPESEAVVAPSASARFRVREVAADPAPIRGVRVSLLGSSAGGVLSLELPKRGDGDGDGERLQKPFDGAAVGVAGNEPERSAVTPTTVRFDVSGNGAGIPADRIKGAEIDFAAADGATYTVQSVTFETAPPKPEVRFAAHADGPLFDERTPVTFGDRSVRVDGVQRFSDGGSDAIRIGYRADADLFSDRSAPPAAVMILHGSDSRAEELQLFFRPGDHAVVVRPSLWGVRARALELRELPAGVSLVSVGPAPAPEGETAPVPVELAELLNYPRERWRRPEFEVFSWSLYPHVLLLDSVDYATQARFFRRLSFFVEKRGFAGRLLTNDELANRHGWNAHNYNAAGLAAFFTAAADEDFPLNPEEETLREIALQRGLIVRADDRGFDPGEGGILAISQESYSELRRLLLVHESMHGVFYSEPAFRQAVFDYWDSTLTDREREFWRDFFGWMTYSPDDRYLIVNEFQGYLLQQREDAVRWYFRSRVAGRLRNGVPSRAAEIDAFLADHPDTFVRAADAVNAALFHSAGMVGGVPFCLVPMSVEG